MAVQDWLENDLPHCRRFLSAGLTGGHCSRIFWSQSGRYRRRPVENIEGDVQGFAVVLAPALPGDTPAGLPAVHAQAGDHSISRELAQRIGHCGLRFPPPGPHPPDQFSQRLVIVPLQRAKRSRRWFTLLTSRAPHHPISIHRWLAFLFPVVNWGRPLPARWAPHIRRLRVAAPSARGAAGRRPLSMDGQGPAPAGGREAAARRLAISSRPGLLRWTSAGRAETGMLATMGRHGRQQEDLVSSSCHPCLLRGPSAAWPASGYPGAGLGCCPWTGMTRTSRAKASASSLCLTVAAALASRSSRPIAGASLTRWDGRYAQRAGWPSPPCAGGTGMRLPRQCQRMVDPASTGALGGAGMPRASHGLLAWAMKKKLGPVSTTARAWSGRGRAGRPRTPSAAPPVYSHQLMARAPAGRGSSRASMTVPVTSARRSWRSSTGQPSA